MSDFEAVITSAIANEEIPGCVLVACNRDGSFKYGKSFGNTSIKAENAKPLALDTVMWVASCTKLMTSISAMQLVERGLVTLDEPVYKYIPELESFTVIKSFDEDGKPIEEKHTKPITLRLLLSHSSGLVYDAIHPKTMAWVAYHKKQRTVGSGKLLERFSAPLVHEPGEGWSYGPSIDYAGLLIERITGKTLQEYMKENIWTPLGITDTTFFLEKRPDMKNRMAGMTLRSEDGKLKPSEGNEAYQDVDGKEMQECMGGHGSFTTAEEYLKVLQGVLTSDENERLLKKETVELFFSPQLGEASSKALNAVLQDDMVSFFLNASMCTQVMGILLMSCSSIMQWAVHRRISSRTGVLVAC